MLTAYDRFIQQALKYGFSLFGTAKSGQLTSYYAYDDGSTQKGYPKTPPRFVDNGDGTITDKASGLMWVKEPGAIGGLFGTPGSPSQMAWELAIIQCNNLNYAGHIDWRLPNIKELFSIIDFGATNPTIDENFFPSTQVLKYWTSTSEHAFTDAKWTINFNDAVTASLFYTDTYYLRPVRLGVPKM